MKWLDENTIQVLDHGLVKLIDSMPREKNEGDSAIVNAARTSYGEGTKSIRNNENLIRYLLRNDHTSPFEMVEFKFFIKMPIFVARQHLRHRTANVNEYSGRYSVMLEEFFVPENEEIKSQSTLNRQGRSEKLPDDVVEKIKSKITELSKNNFSVYKNFLDDNLAREISRIVLPLNSYTQMYWKIDLHNLLRYLRLRLDSHAQYEIRVYAEAICELIKPYVPLTMKAFEDYVINGTKLSRIEKEILLKTLDLEKLKENIENSELSKTEKEEFFRKFFEIKYVEKFS